MSTNEHPSEDRLNGLYWRKQYNDACDKIVVMCDEYQKYEAEIERLKNINSLRIPGSCQCGDDDLCAIGQERDQLRAENAELQKQADAYMRHGQQLTQENPEHENRIEELEKENAELKATNAKLTEQLAAFEGGGGCDAIKHS